MKPTTANTTDIKALIDYVAGLTPSYTGTITELELGHLRVFIWGQISTNIAHLIPRQAHADIADWLESGDPGILPTVNDAARQILWAVEAVQDYLTAPWEGEENAPALFFAAISAAMHCGQMGTDWSASWQMVEEVGLALLAASTPITSDPGMIVSLARQVAEHVRNCLDLQAGPQWQLFHLWALMGDA
jgi:hypothetical protein